MILSIGSPARPNPRLVARWRRDGLRKIGVDEAVIASTPDAELLDLFVARLTLVADAEDDAPIARVIDLPVRDVVHPTQGWTGGDAA